MQRWILSALAILLLSVAVPIARSSGPWTAGAIETERTLVFDTYHELRPNAIYTAEENAAMAEQIEPTEATDASYKILANVRNDRFNEMEYSVPIANGADCLREILATVAEREIDVIFPLEYRYIKGDDLWLSMFEGGDRAAISIHRMAGADYRPYFDAIEPIFWKYGGRPHWGKVHSLGHAQLTKLYPHFEEFRALRAELDPGGRFLNDHLRKVFGV